ncbi:anaerobic glycerol-3-phosphate dehydrogenase subunit C [Solirubrobacter taibaiensis]|nr:anaerobic glycerol-3-phosphate dehydrogenase subunit C [Solirubrobacter taibaiensis]
MSLYDAEDVLGPLLMRGSLDHCVKCTICETYCPVAAVTPLFPGPKYAGPQAERFRSADEPSPDDSLDYCSGCGICTQVCPQGVHIAEINTQARARLKERTGVSLRDRVLARPALAGRLATPVAPVANALLANRPLRLGIEKVAGVHRDAALPRFAGETFRRWARTHHSPPAARRVAYFHGCGANYFEPELARMAVAVLEHNGVQVDVPKQGCCGLPLQSNGLLDDARTSVRRLAKRLAPFAREGIDIVGTSTSCTLMLKREALEILELHDDKDLRIVSERTYDICEYLLGLHERGELDTEFAPVGEQVIYHAPCQQQGHGIGKPALALLALIPGVEVDESVAACCGAAGTYGLKREKYAIAMDVGAPLFDQITAHGSTASICDSETCRWHIQKATRVESLHPIELLHRGYGLADDQPPPRRTHAR